MTADTDDAQAHADEVADLLRPHLPAALEAAGSTTDPEPLAAALAGFCAALREANRAINLTGITDAEGMAYRHVLDSLVALPHLGPPGGAPLVDVGSGCGVPGIPLALADPSREVRLVESRERKCAAIAGLVDTLGLAPRVEAVHARAEAWLAEHDADALVTRAVGSVRAQLELFGPLRRRFRRLVMLKGPAADEELEDAGRALTRFRFPEPERHEATLPGDAGTRVVLVFAGS